MREPGKNAVGILLLLLGTLDVGTILLAQPGGTYQVREKLCKSAKCNQVTPTWNGNCPNGDHTCTYNTETPVVWCKPTSVWADICTAISGDDNSCSGRCTADLDIPCTSTWSKCQNPTSLE